MCENDKILTKSSLERITFTLPHSEKISLKMMSLLTGRTMSMFIRSAIKDKIKKVKGEK